MYTVTCKVCCTLLRISCRVLINYKIPFSLLLLLDMHNTSERLFSCLATNAMLVRNLLIGYVFYLAYNYLYEILCCVVVKVTASSMLIKQYLLCADYN